MASVRLSLSDWAGPDSDVGIHVGVLSDRCLAAYRVNPKLILEHANIEAATEQGGYGRRQLYELIQNGADALVGTRGRIEVVLTHSALYCANEGSAIDPEGVEALLASHVSMKRGTEIGRFGLGFKSVLGVTRHPEFYSRSGSFVFDAIASRRRITQLIPAERTPTLRLATAVSPSDAASDDSVLAELMSWATTVVKLPGGASVAPWLSEDLGAFPSEFLLFCPHVDGLVLDDRSTGIRREIALRQQDHELELTSAGEVSRWRVFSRRHRPSAAARADAGELSNRETVPIHWAVSLAGARRDGRFWAFFPTEYRTTLSGIVNAPWKTNEDRQNLLVGAFNEELIEVASTMVAEEVAVLHSSDDPGRYLDLLPARGRETRNWADELITRSVYAELRDRPSIADQEGTLQRPAEMRLSPERMSQRALTLWSEVPGRPSNWAHHATASRDDRRSRVERLVVEAGGAASSVSAWLRALLEDASNVVDSSIGAVQLAAVVVDELPPAQADVRRATIVLTADGRLVVPHPSTVYLPSGRPSSANVALVASEVAQDAGARAALAHLGIRVVDPAAELESALNGRLDEWADLEWTRFWELCRAVDPSDALAVLERRLNRHLELPGGSRQTVESIVARVRVRTRSGRWRPSYRTMVAGRVLPPNESRDTDVAVDEEFHAEDLALLQRIGIGDVPSLWARTNGEDWYSRYWDEAVEAFVKTLPAGGTQPNPEYLRFDPRDRVPGPLGPLEDLSPEASADFTHHLLRDAPAQWTLMHATRSSTYPPQKVDSPAIWMAKRHGWVRSSLGPRPVSETVAPTLGEFRDVLPVAALAQNQADLLGLPHALDQLRDTHWEAAFEQLNNVEDDVVLGRLMSVAAEHLTAPTQLRCRIGASYGFEPPARVYVTSDTSEFRALVSEGLPALLVQSSTDAELLIEEWGLLASEAKVSRRTAFVPAGPATPLEDAFPGLRVLYGGVAELRLQPCSELRKEIVSESGKTHEPLDFLVELGVVYVAESMEKAGVLRRIARELRFEIRDSDIADILQRRATAQVNRRLAAARQEADDASRLASLVGSEAIQRSLPEPLINAVEDIHGSLDSEKLGRVALAMYGPDALREYRPELERLGLDPPTQWAGSPRAVRFVRELGFAGEFAGYETRSREANFEVEGPRALPDLHPFQREIANRVRALLDDPRDRRGLIALPTGAGKTRVAVQALVEGAREDGFEGPVLWIADRDELCEQAVQAWAEIWRVFGPSHPLHISRFWSGNEAAPVEDAFHVIVATIAKLTASIDEPGYQWLSNVQCVVVDEAHTSIGTSYTSVLNLVGLGRSQRRDQAVLIGLTATPYRGTSAEETERLVVRYGRRRLDLEVLGDSPELTLQKMGVLAQVDHEVLEGVDVHLTPAELHELERLRLLPRGAEQRLGASVERNRTLLESIRSLPADWPILLFATSVQHAQTMAALLTLEGTRAAAVTAETSPGVRRGYVSAFKDGQIRVLTNYGVLTHGFDAPSVRAVYIARPTYSPNVYQQMIGRGLRGPLNGGKERCLVVNVEDTISQFGEMLAFHHFDYLWSGPAAD